MQVYTKYSLKQFKRDVQVAFFLHMESNGCLECAAMVMMAWQITVARKKFLERHLDKQGIEGYGLCADRGDSRNGRVVQQLWFFTVDEYKTIKHRNRSSLSLSLSSHNGAATL